MNEQHLDDVISDPSEMEIEEASSAKPRPNKLEIEEHQSTVLLSEKNDDPTILSALIDRTAPQNKIIADLRRQLTDFGVPYRKLDPQMLEAINLKVKENLSFQEASIRIFGSPKLAQKIRYWRNRWGIIQ